MRPKRPKPLILSPIGPRIYDRQLVYHHQRAHGGAQTGDVKEGRKGERERSEINRDTLATEALGVPQTRVTSRGKRQERTQEEKEWREHARF